MPLGARSVRPRVLDLFAGSGALALEALSRGAAEAVLADSSAEAAACARQNAEAARVAERATIIRADWRDALNRLAGERRAFDLVFLDPPYRMTDTAAICAGMAELGLLACGALIVIEHGAGAEPALDDRFALRDARRYGGGTEIHFYTYRGGIQEHA